MVELPLEYWNTLANQMLLISSLLAGFSIAVIASIMVNEANDRIRIRIFRTTIVAAASFLGTVFSMTKILMMTTPGFPIAVVESDLFLPRIVGFLCFVTGVIALSIVIGLAGWTQSRSTGIFTTVIAILTFLIIVLMLT